MKKKTKKIISVLIAVCIAIALLFGLQALFMPKYMTSIREGAMVSEYYDEEREHDILFVGDCELYENISPITLWEEYGITSYIRGSSQQLIWQSYYLLEDALKYETPDVVVFNVLSMKYNEPQSEAYNRMSIDGMRLSMSKINDVKASMTEEETLMSYVFPLLRYHSRWNELSGEDFKYLFSRDKVTHNGYLMRVDVRPATDFPTPQMLPDYTFGENSYKYLDMMTQLCKEKGIELVLVKAPCLYPHWYDEWDQQMSAYAEENDLMYINFIDNMDDIGIDLSTDTYDMGLHLNLSGAEKFTHYFGKILDDSFYFKDHSEDSELQQIWAEKTKFYYDMKEDQYRELEEFGYLKSYGGRAPDETKETDN